MGAKSVAAGTDGVIEALATALDDSNGIVVQPGEEDYFATILRASSSTHPTTWSSPLAG